MRTARGIYGRYLAAAVLILSAVLTILGAPGSGPETASAAARPTLTLIPQRPQVFVLHVFFSNNAERDRLAGELDAEEVGTSGGYLTVLADQDTYNSILARGLRVELDEQATQQANNPGLLSKGADPDTFDGGYRTVEEMQSFLDTEVAAYPVLAEKVDIGNSWCKDHAGSCTHPAANNGYDLWALHITNRAIPGPKPVFWYDAGIHAREIATPELAMRFINWLLSNYTGNADAHWLVDWHDIWVIPMVNPDGHHIVEAGGNNPYYQRKNANNSNGCTTWPPTSSLQFGTDNNRNFPFLWNCCGGSSSAVCDQTYHGPSSGSDPETQYVVAKIRQLIPDQRGPNNPDAAPITATGVYQSMHSNGALNLYPWGWTTSATSNGPEFANIGSHMSATNAGGNGYPACQPPNCLYAVDGDSADWGYGELGLASFTTEIDGSSFFPTYSSIDSAMWPRNQGALVYQAKIARTPYLLAHGPDANSVATTPLTVTQGAPSQLSATINFAWTGNAFSQNVGAAEYYIDTPPWAGGNAVPMSGAFTSPTVAVAAAVDTSALAPGRHVIFVRGRGVNSYSGMQTWGPISAAFLDVQAAAATVTPTRTAPPSLTATSTATATATATAQPATLVGHVTLQARGTQPDARQSVPVTLTLNLEPGGPDTNYSSTTDASGFFTVTAPSPGTYSYRVKNPQTLSNASNGLVVAPGANQIEMGLLREGDANGDNCVSAIDFNMTKSSFGKSSGEPGYDPRTDFTGDNVVNASDFTILKNNFAMCGLGPDEANRKR